MAFVMDLFRKKKEVVTNPGHVTNINDTCDQDGFVVLDSGIERNNGVLPYATNISTPSDKIVAKSQVTPTKLTDEIPFQFSPSYNKLWTSDNLSHSIPKIKQVNWDALCYDFMLEKSILQS